MFEEYIIILTQAIAIVRASVWNPEGSSRWHHRKLSRDECDMSINCH